MDARERLGATVALVTVVLLKVARICAIPFEGVRRVFFFLAIGQENSAISTLNALLAGHGLLRSLAAASVGSSSLPVNRQPLAVPQSPVTPDVAEPDDVLVRLPPELSLDNIVFVQQRSQAHQLVLAEFPCPLVRIDSGVVTQFACRPRPDTV